MSSVTLTASVPSRGHLINIQQHNSGDGSQKDSVDDSQTDSIDQSCEVSSDESQKDSSDESQKDSSDESQKDSTEESWKDSMDGSKRDSTYERQKYSINEDRRDSIDERQKDYTDETQKYSTAESGKDSIDGNQKDSTAESGKDSIDGNQKDSTAQSGKDSIGGNQKDSTGEGQEGFIDKQKDSTDKGQKDFIEENQQDYTFQMHNHGIDGSQRDFADQSLRDLTEIKQTHANIRQQEQDDILASCHPGHIIQVCGPPMAGKSSLVKQVIGGSKDHHKFLRHDFMCENASSLGDVLHCITLSLGRQPSNTSDIREQQILDDLSSRLMQFPEAHHILVFHKCSSLYHRASKSEASGNMFLVYLWRLIGHLSVKFTVSILLTSTKRFQLKGSNTSTIEIGMLSLSDIACILHHYMTLGHKPGTNTITKEAAQQQEQEDTPGLNFSFYNFCLNTIPLPGVVRLLAEKYLSGDCHNGPVRRLERKILKDENFWFEAFESKMNIVEKWISRQVLASMGDFSQHLKGSFYEAYMECSMATNKLMRQNAITYLLSNYIVRQLPGTNYFVVHPLLIYYLMKHRQQTKMVVQRHRHNHFSNRCVDIMCRMLSYTEANMEKHGVKGRVYGLLSRDWPHIRQIIETAINCNENMYKHFLKAVVSGKGIIIRCFGAEAPLIYSALLDCAKKYGTPSEQGMIEALLGHCKAFSTVLAKGGTWQQAEDCLDSAIDTLRRNGPRFALMWALDRKAIILTRQGKYKESLFCFKSAKRVTVVEADDHELEEMFGISKLQIKEEKLTRDIYMSNVLIFLGENELAQKLLLECLQEMQNDLSDHPELATALNSLGLIEERGYQNIIEALKWYKESYRERLHLAKFSRELLIVSLNNIGMILLKLGKLDECKKYLTEALNIRREIGWVDANTALTLTHMGFVNFKCGDFTAAYMDNLESEKIMGEILINHDSRLRIHNTLGHLCQFLNNEKILGQNKSAIVVEKSAKEYFACTLDIASRTTGNHSDDGYHHLLLAYEHSMLLALENSKEEYDKLKEKILPYFEVSETVGKKVFIGNQKIPNHQDLYKYFSATDYESVDKKIFINHLVNACEFCQIASSFCAPEKIWCEEEQPKTNGEEGRQVTEPMSEKSENKLTDSVANSISEQEGIPDHLDDRKIGNSELQGLLGKSTSEQEHIRSDNQNDKVTKTADSVISTNTTSQLPSPALLKARDNLAADELQYLRMVSDIHNQKHLSPPDSDMNIQHSGNLIPSDIQTNNNLQFSSQQQFPANIQYTATDNTEFNKDSNHSTDYTPADFEKIKSVAQKALKENKCDSLPSTFLKGSFSLLDSTRPIVRFPTCNYTNSNIQTFDNSSQYHHNEDTFNSNLTFTENSHLRDILENNENVVYTDDDDDGVNDHDDFYDFYVNSEEADGHQDDSNRNGQSPVDNSCYHFSYTTSVREDNVGNEKHFRSQPLQTDQTHDMKDALNQNCKPGIPAITQIQHSPEITNKQYQTSSH